MQASTHKPRIIFAVTNCICYDQRVLKMADTLEEMGADITIVGRKRGKCCESEKVPFRTKRFRMVFKKGFLFYKFFNIRLFFYLLFKRCNIIVSNDLDTLPASFLASILRSRILVYDSHEYFTGVPELNGRWFVKGVWKFFERLFMPGVKYIITVSDSIAELYYYEYGVKPYIIRNCSRSSFKIDPVNREILGIGKEKLLLVFQGGGINIDKGGEELIEAMRSAVNAALMIIGSGDVLEEMKRLTKKYGLEEKVLFLPEMPWDEMMKYTRAADAGMCLEKDTNINYRFSLPNKLFDYISAGIPVITGDLPEIKNIITSNSCGIIIPSISPDEIVQAINLLDSNRDLLSVMKQNARDAAGELNWENESVKVKELYLNLLSDKTRHNYEN